jgi:3',5'-cyclic AMP phosphodiesterase CpdA
LAPPVLLLQLSDPHVGAPYAGPDALDRLGELVSVLPARPDAVVVTGDIAHNAAPAEYAAAREVLERIGAPVHALPGNHDDRAELRRAFDLPGDGPVQYVADVGPLRLVVLDSTRPGEDAGELDAERLAWLDATLYDAPTQPTVIALHHPPIVLGIPVWDEIGLAGLPAFAEVVARHPQVQSVVGGHIHRAIAVPFAGRFALSVPSTYLQAPLDFAAETIELVDEPPGYALHELVDGQVVSHVETVYP